MSCFGHPLGEALEFAFLLEGLFVIVQARRSWRDSIPSTLKGIRNSKIQVQQDGCTVCPRTPATPIR